MSIRPPAVRQPQPLATTGSHTRLQHVLRWGSASLNTAPSLPPAKSHLAPAKSHGGGSVHLWEDLFRTIQENADRKQLVAFTIYNWDKQNAFTRYFDVADMIADTPPTFSYDYTDFFKYINEQTEDIYIQVYDELDDDMLMHDSVEESQEITREHLYNFALDAFEMTEHGKVTQRIFTDVSKHVYLNFETDEEE